MNVAETVIGWLAPPECAGCGLEGTTLCELCAAAEILPHGERCGFCGIVSSDSRTCAKCRGGAPTSVWITTDYLGLAQKLLQKYKFGHQRAVADSLADLMARCFYYFNDRPANFLVVPIPTATSRRRQRGFGHSELLASKVAQQLGFEYCPALGRLGQARQVGANRQARSKQLEDSYYARRPDKIADLAVLLVDDVITTGATLRAATKILRRAGAKRVDALVFAKRL